MSTQLVIQDRKTFMELVKPGTTIWCVKNRDIGPQSPKKYLVKTINDTIITYVEDGHHDFNFIGVLVHCYNVCLSEDAAEKVYQKNLEDFQPKPDSNKSIFIRARSTVSVNGPIIITQVR